ncbi:MAG TPA: SRPBCC family protein [Myxococcota bacterium]|nr:SRPBCC family protein [Myxococcota bacterium]
MSEVHVNEPVAAPAAKVWELVRDFGGVAKWGGPALQSCTVEGAGIGAVRRIGLPGGLTIAERLEAYDEAGRSLSYAIVEKSPIPVKDYLSTIRVLEDGPQACRVDWASRFEPDGASAEQAQAMIRGVYAGGIAGLRKALGV